MKKLLSITFLVFAVVFGAIAQDLTVSNVSPKMRKFRGVEAVEGLGYYCFAMDEKSKKGYKIFKLYIWDYDLKQIAKSSVELPKKSFVVDAVYNGENFLVAMYDSKKDKIITLAYNKEGKKVAEIEVDGIKTKFMTLDDYRPSYYADHGRGFYAVIPDKEPKFGFNIIKYDNDLKEQWRSSYFPDKGLQVVMDAESDADKLVILKLSKGSKMSKKVDVDLTAFSGTDGKELWTANFNKSDKVLLPTELAINKNKEVSAAGMYFDGSKIGGVNSDGVFFTHLAPDGKEIGHTSQSWKGKLQNFLKMSKSSFTVGKPKVVFEDIIYDEATGQIKLIGELFTINTAGKVLGMLSGNTNTETKVSIEDLVVFTFTEEGEFTDFYGVNKARTNIFLPNTTSGGVRIAQLLKQSGSLPYRFTGLNAEGEAIAFYLDYLREKDGKLVSAKLKDFNAGKVGVGMLNLRNSTAEDFEVKYLPMSKKAANKDKESDVAFDSKRSIINVTESRPGMVLISELSKKTGDLNLFLESVGTIDP
ncbi:MAG: DUF6770 family protein [Bacteroidota bacterium]